MTQAMGDGNGTGVRPIGRRERKKLEVSRRIREVALEVFREKGYGGATVDEIAERADVAKGTFFNYFPRKDALLEPLAEDLLGGLLDEIGPIESWRGTVRDQLLRLFLRIAELMARDPELWKVVLQEAMRNVWLSGEASALKQELNDLVRSALARGADRGELGWGADVEQGAKLLRAAYATAMVEWLRSGSPGDAYRRELTAQFDIIFRGLGMSS